jgi:MFS family permease
MFNRKGIILTVASTAVFFEALDIAILNLAIPLIQQQFRLENDVMQWLQTVYVLLYGGFLIIGGKLSDSIGRKKIFLAGAVLFLFTSLGAGLSPTFGWLLFFRGLQGLAAAMVMPAALSIITNTFREPKEQANAISVFSSFAAVGSGSGLSIGGLIATYWGWHWIFFINVPVIAIAIMLAGIYIPGDKPATQRSPDVLSALLLILVILMLSYFVHALGDATRRLPLLLALLLLIITGAAIFLRRVRTQQEPYIDLSLLNAGIIVAGNGLTLLLGAVFSGFLFSLSLLMQQNMHFSAARSGFLLFPFSVLSAVVSKFVMPALFKRMSVVSTGVLGMCLLLMGPLLLIAAMHFDHNLALVLLATACITGTGMSVCFPSFTVMAIQGIPPEQHGLASSVCTTSYFIGSGLGLSLLSLFMQVEGMAERIGMFPVWALAGHAALGLLWILSRRRQLEQAVYG